MNHSLTQIPNSYILHFMSLLVNESTEGFSSPNNLNTRPPGYNPGSTSPIYLNTLVTGKPRDLNMQHAMLLAKMCLC